jgi:hypothetical protein
MAHSNFGSYGAPRRASAVAPVKPAPNAPFAVEEDEPTLAQTLASRSFWRQIAIEGIAAAGTAIIVYVVMKRVEGR